MACSVSASEAVVATDVSTSSDVEDDDSSESPPSNAARYCWHFELHRRFRCCFLDLPPTMPSPLASYFFVKASAALTELKLVVYSEVMSASFAVGGVFVPAWRNV